jgi:predicted RecB family nuclease
MYRFQHDIRYSPTDIVRFWQSPFASWMDRFALGHSAQAPSRNTQDKLTESLSKRGLAHEKTIDQSFVDRGMSIARISEEPEDSRRSATLEAMSAGVDVIVQARVERGPFVGFADFLVKEPHKTGQPDSNLGNWHYEVWDTKLAGSVKPSFIIQLCCYADMLESMQGMLPSRITVALGNGDIEQLSLSDYYSYYKMLKNAFLNTQADFDPYARLDPAESKDWLNWNDYAEKLITESDHLLLVAGITRSQIKKLNQAGINTLSSLAETTLSNVPDLNPMILAKLRAQAGIQKRSEGLDIPLYEVIKPKPPEKRGLALLPPHSSLDVFFDIEGFPLDQGGLEYLWGNTYFDEQGTPQFIDFWAHDPAQEKQCFQDFIAWVYARWQKDPTMHIYHYASYEITACRKLMSRYGVCEHEVDQLLRNEVFVDLYKVVGGSLILGAKNYSIKSVELLYRGKRDTEVTNGGESIVVYEDWRTRNAAGEQGDTWETSSILNEIRKYNIDDCDSTQELTKWLRDLQSKHAISYSGKTEVVEPEIPEEVTARTQLRARLLARAETEQATDTHIASLTQTFAEALEFHRRENKPTFFRLYQRLGSSPEELIGNLDCLALCRRTGTSAFKPSKRARNLAYEYQFDIEQEYKGVSRQVYLWGEEDENGRNPKATYLSEHSRLDEGIIVLQSKEPPPDIVTLIPDEHVNPQPIPAAIEAMARLYETDDPRITRSAIYDFLTRSKPRIHGHTGGAIAPSSDSVIKLEEITAAIKNLDSSYLAIQGPPGAGKSHTGKHVIAELLKTGAKVGITSNSHKAINNLLLGTAKHCREQGISANFMTSQDTEPDLEALGVAIVNSGQIAENLVRSCVVGATAWAFSREDLSKQFDYLFIDEAGQVSVANLIAMSRCTRNIVLLGDQMQLGQPTQAAHPGDSGLSVLDYFLKDSPTIPEDMGVFLGTTYRMHSRVNEFISKHVYEGKLHSDPMTDNRIIKVPENYSGPLNIEAGIRFIPVVHEGNTQASTEEVVVIVRLVAELLGRTLVTNEPDKPSRPITWEDILFVAPFNHQVGKLKAALGDRAKVGSVDKFQGQEAPIVFLSMASSDATESARGMDFLLDKNRLNVAISRAQSLAIVVGHPHLGHAQATQIEQLKLLSLYNAITDYIV